MVHSARPVLRLAPGDAAVSAAAENIIQLWDDRSARLLDDRAQPAARVPGSRSGPAAVVHGFAPDAPGLQPADSGTAPEPLPPTPGHAAFTVLLEHRMRQSQAAPTHCPIELAVMCLNIDRFSDHNHVHDHSTGDRVLDIVAARLAHGLRHSDLFARLDGDEFVCVFTQLAGAATLRRLAYRLQDIASAPIHIDRIIAGLQVCVGIAVFPGDGHTAEGLLANARSGLARVKRHRTGCAFFDSGAEA